MFECSNEIFRKQKRKIPLIYKRKFFENRNNFNVFASIGSAAMIARKRGFSFEKVYNFKKSVYEILGDYEAVVSAAYQPS